MKWLQALRQHLPEHKYAIDAKLLGDNADLAWSNLGYWQADTASYPDACQALADQLAQAIHLNAQDHVLDLGCGQGASLLHWLEAYHLQHLSAVEMQPACVEQIQQHLNSKAHIYCASFLNLKPIFPQPVFDAVLCIDAAYHSPLNTFLCAAASVLKANGRVGFHYLMLSEQYVNLNRLQKLKYQALLKAADVNLSDLQGIGGLHQSMEHFKFKEIEIQDISQQVFSGFEHYAGQVLNSSPQRQGLDQFKIQMTAKLCRILYAEGVVRYVQISAQKA